MSELTWRNLHSVETTARIRQDLPRDFYLEGMYGYGAISSGSNQDSDYAGDDRTDEISRSNNSANSGHVSDASLAVGRRFYADYGKTTTSLLAGYAQQTQHLVMTNGVQTVPNQGPFPGLNSSYNTRWRGPWLGVEAQRRTGDKLTVRARAEFHWTNFYGEGNWNLRSDFAHPHSFDDTGHGNGAVLSVGADYTLSHSWQLGAGASLSRFSVQNGVDTLYFATDPVTTSKTRLNAAHWQSAQLSLQLTRHF
jgi:hypothetical protein